MLYRKKILFYLLPLVLFSFFVTVPALAIVQSTVEGSVVSISDGDTFVLLTDNGTKLKIRTAFFDALETPKVNHKTERVNKGGQFFGEEVANALRKKIEGKRVTVDIIDIDRYRRLIGIVFLGSRNINLEMVREGWAEVYREYLRPPYREQFLEAEKQAKKEKRGIWGLPNYERPSDFRKRQRISGN